MITILGLLFFVVIALIFALPLAYILSKLFMRIAMKKVRENALQGILSDKKMVVNGKEIDIKKIIHDGQAVDIFSELKKQLPDLEIPIPSTGEKQGDETSTYATPLVVNQTGKDSSLKKKGRVKKNDIK